MAKPMLCVEPVTTAILSLSNISFLPISFGDSSYSIHNAKPAILIPEFKPVLLTDNNNFRAMVIVSRQEATHETPKVPADYLS